MPSFTKILCPVDFSETSRRALTAATELAVAQRAELVLVHIWQIALYGGLDFGTAGPTLQAMSDDAERGLATWTEAARAGGVSTVTAKMVSGVAWDEICKLVVEPPACDLVVMGTHGRTGLTHALLGSVAERVVRHASCSVLVIR